MKPDELQTVLYTTKILVGSRVVENKQVYIKL